MGLSLERKTLLSCRSERVKAVDFHPTEPWVLSALYNGTVTIRNFQTNVLVKTIEVCELPVRTVKFIARKNWIIVGSDDLVIRVFNYNTLERVGQFTAHSDYIRGFAVHPTRSLVLSCSDDLSIKAWDWEKAWKCVSVFEGHSHYVMAIALNPKDSNTFASVSLDKTIKIWSLSACSAASNSSSVGPVNVKANYTMGEGGHEKGINCVDFYGGSDRPFLVTGSDDFTVRVWDYHTKSCVRVLEGHGNNVSAVLFHAQLPFLLSAGEDSTLRIWNAQTFRPEASYNFGMERAWGLACSRTHNAIGLAFDAGSLVFQLGRGDPCASLDSVQGRLVWSRARGSGAGLSHGNEILTGMVRLLDVEGRVVRVMGDGEAIPLTPKDLGTSDVFPQNLQHSPDGRLVAVWGDGEYVIYSTIGWRNRSFGRGAEVAWASPGGDVFAVRSLTGGVSIKRVSSHEGSICDLPGISDCDRIFGGSALGISRGGSSLSFYDWSGSVLIRTIDVCALSVSWSLDGSHVAILTEDSCYVLSVATGVLSSPGSFEVGEEGIEDSLQLVDELEQVLRSICWISGNCFVYLTQENRLAYHVVGGDADESFQLALFDRSHFLLGFLPSEGRVYLTDQDLQVTSYAILPALIAFQSTVLLNDSQGSIDSAMQLLDSIPAAYYARLAVFLQRRGHLKEALKVSPDAHFQFGLALQLNDLPLARDLLDTKMARESDKWQELGAAALKAWHLPIAEEAFRRSEDLASLFLLYAAAGDVDGLLHVARSASMRPDSINLAFAAFVKAGAYSPAFQLLMSCDRFAEAALFARTYGLSVEQTTYAVNAWRERSSECARAIADPLNHADLFEGHAQFGVVSDDSFNLTGGPVTTPTPSRARSVSFDGNVSVAGSTSTLSLKAANHIGAEEMATSKPNEYPEKAASHAEEEQKTASHVDDVEKFSTTTTIGNTSDFTDFSTTTTTTTTTTNTTSNSAFSDDQMSLEVNTAGTGAHLEDLDEEEQFLGGIEEETEQLGEMDDLSDDFYNNNVEEEGLEVDINADVNANAHEIAPSNANANAHEIAPSNVNAHENTNAHVNTNDNNHDNSHDNNHDNELLVSQLEQFNVSDEPFTTLKVVEQGADIYDVREGEYSPDGEVEENTTYHEGNVMASDSDAKGHVNAQYDISNDPNAQLVHDDNAQLVNDPSAHYEMNNDANTHYDMNNDVNAHYDMSNDANAYHEMNNDANAYYDNSQNTHDQYDNNNNNAYEYATDSTYNGESNAYYANTNDNEIQAVSYETPDEANSYYNDSVNGANASYNYENGNEADTFSYGNEATSENIEAINENIEATNENAYIESHYENNTYNQAFDHENTDTSLHVTSENEFDVYAQDSHALVNKEKTSDGEAEFDDDKIVHEEIDFEGEDGEDMKGWL